MEDAAASEAEVGSISDEPTMEEEDALDGLSEDEAKIELLVVAAAVADGAEDELLMLLDRPRFKMLALFRTALVPAPRERLEVNAGELLGCSELTGVATSATLAAFTSTISDVTGSVTADFRCSADFRCNCP